MLNKKQNITDNAQWIEAFNKATTIYSRQDIKELEARTIALIQEVASGYSNICSGWIAGKDSLVLDKVLQKSNIKYTPVMWAGVNQYPQMQEWIERNKPKNLLTEVIDKFSLDFIEKHPDYLFCQNGTRQRLMAEKWKRYKKDMAKHNFDLLIVGRRLKDGNVCGSKGNNYVVSKTFDTFSPLAEWTHEQLLAYIQYENIELPPFYSWQRGFLIGSVAMGEWTERPVLNLTVDDVWKEIYSIDKSIIIKAAEKLTSAKKFLERIQK